MNAVIVLLDSDNRVTSVQRVEDSGLPGQLFLARVHPLDRPTIESLFRRLDHAVGVACAERVMLRVSARFEWWAVRAIRTVDRRTLLHLQPAIRCLEERRFLAMVNDSIQREQELNRLIPVLRTFNAPELAAIRRDLAPLTPASRSSRPVPRPAAPPPLPRQARQRSPLPPTARPESGDAGLTACDA